MLYGIFSSGVSGHSLVHSDVGGYTVLKVSILLNYVRSKELLLRWIELSTFSDSLIRFILF